MNRTRSKFIGFFIVLTVACVFQLSPLAERASNWLLDGQFAFLRSHSSESPDEEIAIVGINSATFEQFRAPVALWHPHLGAFLNAMFVAEPRVVILDVVLPDRSYNFLSAGYDKPLLSGLLKFRGRSALVLAQTVDENGRMRPLYPPLVAIAGQDSLGLALVKTESDGVVRRTASFLETDKGQFSTLLGRTLERLGLPSTSGVIDFAVGEPFSYLPFHEVLALHEAGEHKRLKQLFSGKHVFLGAVLPFADRNYVPVPLADWEPQNRLVPGVLIHAQALRSILTKGLIQPAPRFVVLPLVIVVTLIWWICGNVFWGTTISLVSIGALWGGSTWLLAAGTMVPMAGVGFAILLALVGRLGLESLAAFLDRRHLKLSFGRYVSPNVLKGILSGHIKPGVGGERRYVCVLFSDIRSFTTRSESQAPEAIITLLNDYFEEMTAAVHRYGGTIDKFIGDGLMAFFGAPNQRGNAAQDAFDAAQEMLKRLAVLNETLEARGIEPIQIGLGMDVGDVVVGHVGSQQRHEYTAIGDTVNTAARLEGLTKGLGYPVVVSARVAECLDAKIQLVDLGEQAVKGRAPVPVFGWPPRD